MDHLPPRMQDQLYHDMILPDEVLEVRKKVRAFAESEIAPVAHEIANQEETKENFPRELFRGMAANELFRIPFPQRSGRHGLRIPRLRHRHRGRGTGLHKQQHRRGIRCPLHPGRARPDVRLGAHPPDIRPAYGVRGQDRLFRHHGAGGQHRSLAPVAQDDGGEEGRHVCGERPEALHHQRCSGRFRDSAGERGRASSPCWWSTWRRRAAAWESPTRRPGTGANSPPTSTSQTWRSRPRTSSARKAAACTSPWAP